MKIFIIAGEESGDALGAGLMAELKLLHPGEITFRGVGGPGMRAEGLETLFPMDDITAMGFVQVIAGLPRILRRMRETADAIVADPPDILVLIDAPDFTHRVAHKVRARLPDLRIVKYVAPTVWVWRPGRARAMAPDIDQVLAVLPFEPEIMNQLGGPPTTYVGHPLLSDLSRLHPDTEEAARRAMAPPVLLVLPGSRRTELARLGEVFGQALGALKAGGQEFELVLPTLPRRRAQVEAMIATWPVRPRVVVEEGEKYAAFRQARAALAASGTVTLELALAGVPMVTAYKVSKFEGWIGPYVLRGGSVILPNIILGENVVPEFLQQHCTADALTRSLGDIIPDGLRRQAQIDAFTRLEGILSLAGDTPSRRAALAVLATRHTPQ
ncbi:MAG TPA: lipid-A-disaccharide synthase [Ancylobacter sp.]